MEDDNIILQIKAIQRVCIKYLICKDEEFAYVENKRKMASPTQMQVMEYIIQNNENDINQRNLEKDLELSRATISGVLSRMEVNGLIDRIVDTKDSRIKYVKLTEKAKGIFIKGKKKIERLNALIARDVNEDDLKITFDVLSQIEKTIKNEIEED